MNSVTVQAETDSLCAQLLQARCTEMCLCVSPTKPFPWWEHWGSQGSGLCMHVKTDPKIIKSTEVFLLIPVSVRAHKSIKQVNKRVCCRWAGNVHTECGVLLPLKRRVERCQSDLASPGVWLGRLPGFLGLATTEPFFSMLQPLDF